MTARGYEAPKHRQIAHPLFHLFFRPMGVPLARRFGSELAAIGLTALMAALGIVAFLHFLIRVGVDRKSSWVLSGALAVSTAHVVYGSLPETFIFSFASLMVMPLLFVGIDSDRRFVRAHAIATVFSVGVTITNAVPSALWFLARVWRQERQEQLKNAAIWGGLVLALFGAALFVQDTIYPPHTPFFSSVLVREHRYFVSDEVLSRPVSFFLERAPQFFVHSIVAPSVVANPLSRFQTLGLEAGAVRPSWFVAALLYLLVVGFAALALYRSRSYRSPIFVVLATYFLFNVALHLVYGVTEVHLYVAHYTFALLGMIAFGYRGRAGPDDADVGPSGVARAALVAFAVALAVNNSALLLELMANARPV